MHGVRHPSLGLYGIILTTLDLLQILASAELLHDTYLTNTQEAYLKTVQACAQSLVETVNHVLDFTKLSGNSTLR